MTKMSSPLISLNNAGIKRAERWLVRNVMMEINAGEIVTLIGPNGSGKSTTAKMALGLLAPDEGAATRREGMSVSYVPQNVSIDWTLPLDVHRFMRLTGRVSASDIDEALQATDVRHLADAEMRTLSGGEFQRVLIARAIARHPNLVVLDEPVQGVDFTGEIALYDLIKKIRDDLNCGVLLISHDLHVVMAATDRVLCLNGHVCCSGTPASVAESAAYKSLFGPRAAPNLAVYEHQHDHMHHMDGSLCKVDENGPPHNDADACSHSDHQKREVEKTNYA